MKLRRIIAIAAAGIVMLAGSIDAAAWGQKGHEVTCAIAEKHLSKKAQKKINEIFEGKSIVYWASWLDNASRTPELAYTKTWHYKNIDADEAYETAQLNEAGDVITALTSQIAALKSGTLNHEAEAQALKMVVHLVGDLHCPMHMGHRSDSGGNRWQIQFFNNGTNLHSLWDSAMLERAHNWGYSEWVDQLDRASKDEVKAIMAGSLDDWGKETYKVAEKCYELIPVGSKLSYDEVRFWTPTIEEQLLRGGLRLAAVLNSIF